MKLFSTKENLFFMAGHFATDLCHGSMPIILAYMYQAGRLDSYSSVALLMMANTILNALIQPLAGNLADSKPRPYLMSIGIACAFLGVMFIGFIQNQYLLYSLVCLNGVGSALFHPAGGKMANVFGGAKLGKSMSIFSVGGNFGMACGPFYFTGFYILFGLDATLAMCIPGIAIIAIYIFKNHYYTVACLHHNHEIKRATSENTQQENVKGFIYLVCILFVRSAGWFSFVSFLSLYYMHKLNISDEIATLLNGMVALVGALATFTGGTVSDKIGFNRIITFASLASAPFIILFTQTDNATIATLLLIPFSLLFFAAMSPTVVVGQKLLCKHVGMATGFTIGLSMSFGGLVAPLMGKLGDAYGIEYIMYAVAFFITVAAIGTIFIPKVSTAK